MMSQPFRIKKRDSFRILGYTIDTTNQHKEATKAIPAFWESFNQKHLAEEIMPLNNQEPLGLFGVSIYNEYSEDPRKFRYFIAVSSDHPKTSELSEYIIPACTWAVFPCTIETIGKTEAQAIMKWLPRSSYQPKNKGYITGRMKSEAVDIQYYGKDGLVEVWVAVKDK